MKKRLFSMLLVVALLSTLFVGCGGSTPAPASSAPAVSSAAAPAASSPAPAAKKPTYTLRFGHVLTDQDAFHKAFVEWGKSVTEKTKGDLLVEVYPSAQLGVEEDVLEQMRRGSNVGWQTDAARLGNYVNEISVLNAPYFLENLEEVKKLFSSKAVGEWNKKLEDQFKIKIISFAYVQGYRSVFSNKMGKNPTDFKGMMIRTAGAPIWVQSVNSLGCKAVAVPYGELYNAIQTKVVDGCELPYAAAYNLKVFEVAKYILETKHIYQMNFLVCSADWFNKLPKEYQTLLIDEANKAGVKVSEQLQKDADGYKQKMIEKGMTYVPYDQMDINAFKKGGQAAYDALKLDAAREAVYKELGKTVVK